MAGITKTRVDYGDKGSAVVKDQRTNDNPTPSSVSDATNAKVPISGGIKNESRTSTSKASPATRKNSGM